MKMKKKIKKGLKYFLSAIIIGAALYLNVVAGKYIYNEGHYFLESPECLSEETFVFDNKEMNFAVIAKKKGERNYLDIKQDVTCASLFYDYGLKICGVSAVPTEDGEILFALVSRGAVIHRPPTYCMFHILPEEEATPISLLGVLEPLGVALSRLDPVPLTYDPSRVGYRVIASAGDADAFVSLSVYLSLYAPGYTGYGFYTQF